MQRKKAKKTRKRVKKRRHHSSSEYCTSSSNDMFQRVEKVKMKISQRQTFPVVLQENINEYDLSYDLAEYTNDYCKKNYTRTGT